MPGLPTCGCIMTFRGAVVGCDPMTAGPRGLAKCRKVSPSTILSKLCSWSIVEESRS